MAALSSRKPAKKARAFVADRVARAIEELDKPGPLELRVHEARRDLRKARAALKLLRPRLASRVYRIENALCRDAARLLAPARDAQALEAAWKKLRVKDDGMARRLNEDAWRAAAALDPRTPRTLLSQAETEAKKLAPAESGWAGLKPGLRRTYSAARRAWKRARRTGEAADFHEWRKRVKDERYQLELLGRDASRLEQLADILGEEHDLVVLREKLGAGDVEALRAIGRRRSFLRETALGLAEKAYAGSARAYERQVHRAWRRDLKS